MNALQTLSNLRHALTQTTHSETICQLAYQAAAQISGDIDNFLVVQFDSQTSTIQVLYWAEKGATQHIDSFDLGDDVISDILKTGKSIGWGKNPGSQVNASPTLFAQRFAKSLVGVPLMVGGDVTGALVLQDFTREDRFDENDQQLTEVIAGLMANHIQRSQSDGQDANPLERARQLYEISNKIRNSTDIQAILATATQELSKALGIRRAQIKINVVALMTQDKQSPNNSEAPASMPDISPEISA